MVNGDAMPAKEKPQKFPKTLGACADELYTTRQLRLETTQIVDALKRRETGLRTYMIEKFNKTDLQGATGNIANVSTKAEEHPVVDTKNWKKLWAWIFKGGHYDLLPRSISTTAWREMRAAGIKIPYVTVWKDFKMSVTKVPERKKGGATAAKAKPGRVKK